MKTDRGRIYKLLLGAVIIMAVYFGYSKGKHEENDCEFINKDGRIIDMSYAKLEKFTEEDSVDIAYPQFNADDEVSRKMNEQIFYAMIAGDILEDDGYADRAEIKYEVPYADDRIISIHFTGYKGKGLGNENLDMGMNFDLSSGELLCLADFFGLKELRDLLENAVDEGKLSVVGFPLNDSEKAAYIDSFLEEFASDGYINETENFYLQENRICFLAEPYPSMKQKVCLALEVDELPAIQRLWENDETRAAGNTAEGNESASAEDLGSQASVEKSDEAEGVVFGETYSLKRSKGLTFYVNIHYPQLKNTKNVDTEKANELLKDAAFSIWGKTADETTAFLEAEMEDLSCSESFEADYEILWLDESCISVIYMLTFYTSGASAYTHHYMTTVDIGKGEYIEWRDLPNVKQLIQTLQAGDFEVYTGTYSALWDEDIHKTEEMEQFIQAFIENLAFEKIVSGFNRFSSKNIGLDEKSIYIYVPDTLSLDGHFILCVPQESDVVMDEQASAEGTAFVFDHWLDFAGADFSEEWGIPYVDDETFEVIKKAYEQVDFFGEFESGNEAVYDEYKEKYKELLENDGLVFDEKAGTSIPFSQIDDIGRYMERNETVYYFFDIDGDDLPELSVHIFGQGIYALDYDTEKDAFSVWYPMGSYAYSLIGTRKVQWHGNGHWLAFYLLDESGEEACYTFFFGMQKSAESYLAAAMMPEYSEKEKNLKLTEAMKSQGIYTRSGGEWYFRITKEQYDELSKPYWEAYDRAEEKKKEVTYTYEELFGEG